MANDCECRVGLNTYKKFVSFQVYTKMLSFLIKEFVDKNPYEFLPLSYLCYLFFIVHACLVRFFFLQSLLSQFSETINKLL